MSAAARLLLATTMADEHADHCRVCDPPSVDRSGAACRVGHQLDHAFIGAWRARVDALSDGRRLR